MFAEPAPGMPKLTPIQRAVAKFDNSPTRMATAIGSGVLRQHVEHWLKSGRVPAEHVRRVQELTGVMCWEFRPNDWWRIWPDLIGTAGAPRLPAADANRTAQRS